MPIRAPGSRFRRALIGAAGFTVAVVLTGCGRAGAGKPTPTATAPSLWSDVAAARGLHFTHGTGVARELNIVQATGSGCGFIDYDDDGWLDLFLVQGDTASAGSSRLFRNIQGQRFEDVTVAAGIRTTGYGMGCAVGDYDGDTDLDLYVCSYGRNQLYRNEGQGRFRDVTQRAGVGLTGGSVSATFFDADGDRDLDLFVVRYVRFTPQDRQLCMVENIPTSCPPRYYAAEADVLYINQGDGRFRDGTRAAGIRDTNGRGLAVIPVDFERDGDLDLFVCNDGTADALWVNDGRGKFHDRASELGCAYDPRGKATASMGQAWGDLDGDEWPDLVIGNFQNEPNSVFMNRDEGGFVYSAVEAGLADATTPSLTWGLGLLDFENDGDLDLLQVNGHVQDRIADIDPGFTFAQRRQFFENSGQGRFVDRTDAGGLALTDTLVGRGLALGDVNNDGRVDALVNNLGGSPSLLLNESRTRHAWLTVDLRWRAPNTRALGARIKVVAGGKTQWREVNASAGFAGACDPRAHFGLGAGVAHCSVEVLWPDGAVTRYPEVPVNRIETIRGGK